MFQIHYIADILSTLCRDIQLNDIFEWPHLFMRMFYHIVAVKMFTKDKCFNEKMHKKLSTFFVKKMDEVRFSPTPPPSHSRV